MAGQSDGLLAFIDMIELIADNKYVLGDRLVEVGVSGPDLEASLAAVAMAQGELGHARLLYNWIFDLKEMGEKPEIKGQTGRAYKGTVKINSWISLIAVLYTVNIAQKNVLNAVLEAAHSDVVTRIHKLTHEQKEHIMYAQGWVSQLLHDEGAIPVKFNEALDEIAPEVEAWLKQIEGTSPLVEEGYLPKGVSLLKPFQEQIAKTRLAKDVVEIG